MCVFVYALVDCNCVFYITFHLQHLNLDMKPQNCLVNDNGCVKLADFGEATFQRSTRLMSRGIGTIMFSFHFIPCLFAVRVLKISVGNAHIEADYVKIYVSGNAKADALFHTNRYILTWNNAVVLLFLYLVCQSSLLSLPGFISTVQYPHYWAF